MQSLATQRRSPPTFWHAAAPRGPATQGTLSSQSSPNCGRSMHRPATQARVVNPSRQNAAGGSQAPSSTTTSSTRTSSIQRNPVSSAQRSPGCGSLGLGRNRQVPSRQVPLRQRSLSLQGWPWLTTCLHTSSKHCSPSAQRNGPQLSPSTGRGSHPSCPQASDAHSNELAQGAPSGSGVSQVPGPRVPLSMLKKQVAPSTHESPLSKHASPTSGRRWHTAPTQRRSPEQGRLRQSSPSPAPSSQTSSKQSIAHSSARLHESPRACSGAQALSWQKRPSPQGCWARQNSPNSGCRQIPS